MPQSCAFLLVKAVQDAAYQSQEAMAASWSALRDPLFAQNSTQAGAFNTESSLVGNEYFQYQIRSYRVANYSIEPGSIVRTIPGLCQQLII